MKLSGRVKPISYLKANAPKVMRDLARTREPMVITRRGEACAILQDVESYEKTQETLAMLQMIGSSMRQVKEGKTVPARTVFERLRRRRARRDAAE
jgi:prevent-host-death family protein